LLARQEVKADQGSVKKKLPGFPRNRNGFADNFVPGQRPAS